jgi:hypothetical protein
MLLVVERRGTAQGVYGETIDLSALGALSIRRASHVEPDERGRWWADLRVSGGPKLGPFTLRSTALTVELQWLERALRERRPSLPT